MIYFAFFGFLDFWDKTLFQQERKDRSIANN
jgi:hypothetical protein